MEQSLKALSDLAAVIDARARENGAQSYTAKLLSAGASACARKFGEEAVELIIAALESDSGHIKSEAADVLYHLLVLLKASSVSLSDVMSELRQRQAQSGLAEKAARKT